ncbi:MAG: PAS domain S-box protein [Sphingobacteriales bacterium]|nr:MAG: PAS domain S-box protein [Sphingobacteriales bacterium]
MTLPHTDIFRKIPEMIVILSPAYIMLDATEAYLEGTFRTRESLIGKSMMEEFPDNPDDPSSNNSQRLKASIDNAVRTKKTDYLGIIRYDIPVPENMGGGFTYDYWEATHTPVLNASGEVEYVIQVTNKVTERELAKHALAESESNFRFMAESMPQLVWTANSAGEILYLNNKWQEYTGLEKEEFINKDWGIIIHHEDTAASKEKWENAVKNADEYQVQYRLKDKDGAYRWFLARSIPRKDENNKVQMWVGSATDIHDTKLMVDELVASNEQMAALSDKVQEAYERAETEKQTLETLIMEAPAMICILKGPEHRFELVNPIYQAVFPDRVLTGKTVSEAIPETVEQGFIDLLDNVYKTGESFIGKEILLKLYNKESKQMEDAYFTFTYQPIYETGKIIGIVAFAINVTDTVNLRNKLAAYENQNQG